ncbi:MAG: c-type cytochrome domain-containing protein, partial [Planctomycetaceae bacterium]
MKTFIHARYSMASTFVGVVISATATCAAADSVSFMRDVAPILCRRCEGCHGSKHKDGEFRLDSFRHLMTPNSFGSPLIVPGYPDRSELLQRLISDDDDLRMPQEDGPLTAKQIEVIRRWIADGAIFDGKDERLSLRRQRPPREHPRPPVTYRSPVPVTAIALSPTGDELATGGYHEVLIWAAASGRLLRRIPDLPERILDLAFSRGGRHLLVGGGCPGDYGEVALFDLQTAKKERVFGTFEDVVLGVTFSRDGKRVAASSADHTVRVYNTTGAALWEKRVHADWVTAVSFSHDDRFLASSSRDMTVKVFDVPSGHLFTTYSGHRKQFGKNAGQHKVHDVVFSADTLLACSAGTDNVIRLWDPVKSQAEDGTAADMELRFSKEGHTRYIEHGSPRGVQALDLDGDRLFCAGRNGHITQYEVLSGDLVHTYDTGTPWIYSIDYEDAAHRMANGCADGSVQVWDTITGELVNRFTARPESGEGKS